MKNLYLFIFLLFIISCTPKVQDQTSYAPTQTFQLANPQLQIDSILFQKTGKAKLELKHQGTEIRYTLDGSEVNDQSLLYSSPIQLTNSGILKAKAFHSDFQPSETIEQVFFKISPLLQNAAVELFPQPHPNYQSNGITALTDFKKGVENFSKGHWLGFKSKEVTIDIKFDAPQLFSKVNISLLSKNRSWIFLPKQIEIYFNGKQKSYKTLETPTESQPTEIKYISLPIDNFQNPTKDLQIKIINLPSIPDFHNGKGYIPWLFIDEIWIE